MDKKDYIDAINEIKVGDDLKNKTFEKIKGKKDYKKTYTILATAITAFAVAISIIIPINNNKNKINPIEVVEENNGLPKVENFENLYNIMKDKESQYNGAKGIEIIDGMSPDSFDASINSSNKIESSRENLDYSNTNTQVDGVDEADIVKTDGKCIYYLSSNKIVIVNAEDSANLKILSEINYKDESFYPRELFISDNKLVVIGNIREDYNIEKSIISTDIASYSKNINGEFTAAKLYNIEDKSKPKMEREVKIEGNYLSSRMIGDNVYFISNKYMYSYLFRNTEIEDIDENDFKPKYIDTAISKEKKCIEFSDISYFPGSEDTSYLNIASFNVSDNKEAFIESYLGAGEEIYSSENNLYITKVKYEYKDSKIYGYYSNYDINTYIYKFKLEDGQIEYINVGSVPGEVLNQFSMDEKDGYFRIATTDSNNWNGSSNSNNLYVLNENLKVVGKVENLAKGEEIYSVRFMGNRAYMVTFVQVDPLFVIDLSDPTNPMVLGELKIPGYSKYLHPYDENHIIGFGENTKETEYGAVKTDGMKMALFDVTDPNNPKELFAVDIGEKGTYSELLYNHKALLFSKEKDIIAFPISISEEEGTYHSKLKFQGAIVYGLNLEKGFTLKGTIPHMQIQNGYADYDYTKEVERIIYIKDNLYTLSEGLIKSTDMNTMEEKNSVEIEVDKNSYSYYLE